MVFPHCTIWRITLSRLVFSRRCGVPLAGFGDTGPAAAARPAWSDAFGAADEAEASPDAPVTTATVITPAAPHKRQCPGPRIVSLTPLASRLSCAAPNSPEDLPVKHTHAYLLGIVTRHRGVLAAWTAAPGAEPPPDPSRPG